MGKRNNQREQKSKKSRDYSTGGKWKNDQLGRALNKFLGLSEDFQGDVKGLEKEVSMAANVFDSHKTEEIPKNEKNYSHQ